MKKLALAAVACCALATPAFAAGGGTNVKVTLTNVAMVSQGGHGNGQVNTAIVAQGAIATVQAPHNAPIVDIHNFGSTPLPDLRFRFAARAGGSLWVFAARDDHSSLRRSHVLLSRSDV